MEDMVNVLGVAGVFLWLLFIVGVVWLTDPTRGRHW